MTHTEPEEHRVRTPHAPEVALGRARAAAEAWGATVSPSDGGLRIELPAQAGVRSGVLRGLLTVTRTGGGSLVTFRIDESRWAVHRPAVVILAFGAVGALATIVWPLWPPLLAFAPVAVVLAIAAWLLVVARLRSSGAEEYLRLVAEPEEPPEARGGESGAAG